MQQLQTNEVVEIKHSSRDTVMFRIAQEISNHPERVAAKSLVFRSGVSLIGSQQLMSALESNETTIEALEFMCLTRVEELQAAIDCCSRSMSPIKELGLTSYTASTALRRRGQTREDIALTIRNKVFGSQLAFDRTEDGHNGMPSLRTLSIECYPLGSEGAQILAEAVARNTSLTCLKLVDSDLRSDSAKSVAEMIRANRSLSELDLSYNRHYLGSDITRELTLKTLVQRGLRYNMTLNRLDMRQTRGKPFNRSKVDRQLDITKFRNGFSRRDPFSVPPSVWPHILGRVSSKPAALHLFLQDGVVTLFR